jgi:uncharacterized protein YeaO (DUF488 family)
MTVRVVRLGTPRGKREGLRLGTVRRPPRGVPRTRYAEDDWYDVWLPVLAPSAPLVKQAFAARTDADWRRYARRYRAEMAKGPARDVLGLLAALSHHAAFAVGCYC